jgi:hypothetical protein
MTKFNYLARSNSVHVVFLHIPQLEFGHGINSHYQGKGQGSQNHHVCRVR